MHDVAFYLTESRQIRNYNVYVVEFLLFFYNIVKRLKSHHHQNWKNTFFSLAPCVFARKSKINYIRRVIVRVSLPSIPKNGVSKMLERR